MFVDSGNDKDVLIFPTSGEQLRIYYQDKFENKDALDLFISAYDKMNQKDFDEANEIYKKALLIEPNNKYIYHSLGNSFSSIREIDLAKYNTLKSIKIDSTFDIAINSYGLYLMSQDSFILAGKYFSKAIELDPSNEIYYLNKAINFSNQKYLRDSCCKYVKLAEKYKRSSTSEFIKEVKEENNCD